MGSARFRIHTSPQGWAFSLVAPNHRVMALSARPGPDVPTVLVWIDAFRQQTVDDVFEIVADGQPGQWRWRLRSPVEIAVCPAPLPRRIDAAKAAQSVRRAAAVADVRVPAGTPLSGGTSTRPAAARRGRGDTRPRRPLADPGAERSGTRRPGAAALDLGHLR